MKTFTILEALNIIKDKFNIDVELINSIEYTNPKDNLYTFTLFFVNRGYKYIIDLDWETYVKHNL